MAARIPGMSFTRTQLFRYAYTEARKAGLDTNTADAVAHKVLERVLLEGATFDIVIQQEITKHAQP